MSLKINHTCFIRSRQNYLSRYHATNSYFSRLPSRKIKTFSVSWVYLIPFPAILKPNFLLSRLKKWQIPRPEKALLNPLTRGDLYRATRHLILNYILPPRPLSNAYHGVMCQSNVCHAHFHSKARCFWSALRR